MKTSNRFLNLVIACVVLAGLAGWLYWSNRHQSAKAATSAVQPSPTILKVNQADVAAITIKAKDAPALSLARDSNQAWQITEPKPLHADPEQVSMLLSSLAPLSAQELVANNATGLSQYGLGSPSLEVDITQKNHPEQRLLIGDDTPVGSSAYAMVAGDPRVYTMDAKSSLNKTLNDLRDKRLITLSSDQMNRIELDSRGAAVVLDHTAGGWAMQKPAPYRTDSMAADGLASALADAQMGSTQPSEKDVASDFAKGTPVATVKVTGASGTQTLEVRKGSSADFVKSSEVPGIYQVDSYLGDSLNKTADDFRNKQVFDSNNAEPDAIQLQIAGAKASTVDMVHNAQGWWRNGKKMDSDSAESLVSSLRDLMATGFATSGFTTPEITATVTSNGGKRRETVEIAKVENGKSGTQYVARRANDPSLYILDPSAVEGIEDAAAAIKPAGK